MTAPDARPLALVTGASRGIGAAVAAALAPTHDLLLVHSAGIGPLGTVEDTPAEQWRRTFEVARAVLFAVTAPADADVTELSVRPAPR